MSLLRALRLPCRDLRHGRQCPCPHGDFPVPAQARRQELQARACDLLPWFVVCGFCGGQEDLISGGVGRVREGTSWRISLKWQALEVIGRAAAVSARRSSRLAACSQSVARFPAPPALTPSAAQGAAAGRVHSDGGARHLFYNFYSLVHKYYSTRCARRCCRASTLRWRGAPPLLNFCSLEHKYYSACWAGRCCRASTPRWRGARGGAGWMLWALWSSLAGTTCQKRQMSSGCSRVSGGQRYENEQLCYCVREGVAGGWCGGSLPAGTTCQKRQMASGCSRVSCRAVMSGRGKGAQR